MFFLSANGVVYLMQSSTAPFQAKCDLLALFLAFSSHVALGEATGAQALELFPQRLNNVGLVLLGLTPQVLLQVFMLQRPQRVTGVDWTAWQTPRLDSAPTLT